MKKFLFVLILAAMPGFSAAAPIEEMVQDREVVILGEMHDNPAHHETQARLTGLIAPSALVFEMLSADQVARITSDLRGDPEGLEKALNWSDSGWPDFAMYYQVMQAAPDAAIFGA
ncbi:MAG: ChaN family lipoprotein, partial [Thalassovita sp.]|nr:ChaN family lipoprotein [Thalassovita sp.]